MPDDVRLRALWLIFLILIIALIAIVMISMLLRVWRRGLERDRREKRGEGMPDLWQIGGDRLLDRIEREGGDASFEEEEHESPDEDDDEPWRGEEDDRPPFDRR